MNSSAHQETLDAGQCPLCGQPNDCQLCTVATYKGPCWCAKIEIPDDLLALVPSDLRNKACICRACILAFHRERRAAATAQSVLPGDFFFDANNLMVFTAAYHLRRGYCCESGCRHCPYAESKCRANSRKKMLKENEISA